MDHRQQYRQSQLDLIDTLNELADDDIDKPTVCVGWTVRDIMRHVIANHYHAVASANGTEYDAETDERLHNDPRAEFPRAADAAWQVMQRDEALDGTVEFAGAQRPAWVQVSFQFSDILIHIWDIRRSLSMPDTLRPELVSQAQKVADMIGDSEAVRGEGKPFGKIVATTSTNDQDRLLAVTGRDPAWTP